MQAGIDPDRRVFLDETWIKTNMTCLYGRSLRGTRLIDAVPHGHWKTTTFLAGLTTRGLIAPLVIDGPINGDVFVAYVTQQLVPVLAKGSLVILNNLSSHKRIEVREAIEEAESELVFLPSYSPDLNPIELAFSKFKHLVRKAKAQTVKGLEQPCGNLIDQFPEHQCRNTIQHCGYRYD